MENGQHVIRCSRLDRIKGWVSQNVSIFDVFLSIFRDSSRYGFRDHILVFFNDFRVHLELPLAPLGLPGPPFRGQIRAYIPVFSFWGVLGGSGVDLGPIFDGFGSYI